MRKSNKTLVLAFAMVVFMGAQAFAITTISRTDIINYAKTAVGSWYVWGGDKWDPNNRSWAGADCSGLVIKAWRVPKAASYKTSVGHPYSTYSFYHQSTHWYRISRSSIQMGDALVRRNSKGGHIFIFHKKDQWGKPLYYEAYRTGTRIRYGTRSAGSEYVAIRRKSLSNSGGTTTTTPSTPSTPTTTTPSVPTNQATPVVRVTASYLNVRSGPSTGYRIVGQVRSGQNYIAVSTSGSWVQIYFGSSTAWVHSNYLQMTSGVNKLRINASWLNVRSGPSTGYRKVGQTSKGKIYAILSTSGSWVKIWYDGNARWVYAGSGYASFI